MFRKIISNINFILWKKIHGLPREVIKLWQFKELIKITRHAYLNTKLYNDLYRKKININHIKKIQNLENLPITKKEIFKNYSFTEYLYTKEGDLCYLNQPFKKDKEAFLSFSFKYWDSPYSYFLSYRFLFWNNINLAKVKNTSTVIIDRRFYLKKEFGSMKAFSPYEIKIERNIKKIFESNPVIIESTPSLLIDFIKIIKEFPHLKNPALKYVISKGENLTPSHRKFIEENLDCEVYNRYETEEFGSVGIECKCHEGFHINNESFIVEIVDVEGKSVPLGTSGDIIITDLRNYAMPFIRYYTGDQGYFLNKLCSCKLHDHRLVLTDRKIIS